MRGKRGRKNGGEGGGTAKGKVREGGSERGKGV